ncbi:uncharacterized protein [Hyperolius riggenbachi]|uniref:uncharacterized protein n=1 Tax=Hyperolius riggenbachi TaxID=752182 RepID=UPI0035A2A17F
MTTFSLIPSLLLEAGTLIMANISVFRFMELDAAINPNIDQAKALRVKKKKNSEQHKKYDEHKSHSDQRRRSRERSFHYIDPRNSYHYSSRDYLRDRDRYYRSRSISRRRSRSPVSHFPQTCWVCDLPTISGKKLCATCLSNAVGRKQEESREALDLIRRVVSEELLRVPVEQQSTGLADEFFVPRPSQRSRAGVPNHRAAAHCRSVGSFPPGCGRSGLLPLPPRPPLLLPYEQAAASFLIIPRRRSPLISTSYYSSASCGCCREGRKQGSGFL